MGGACNLSARWHSQVTERCGTEQQLNTRASFSQFVLVVGAGEGEGQGEREIEFRVHSGSRKTGKNVYRWSGKLGSEQQVREKKSHINVISFTQSQNKRLSQCILISSRGTIPTVNISPAIGGHCTVKAPKPCKDENWCDMTLRDWVIGYRRFEAT